MTSPAPGSDLSPRPKVEAFIKKQIKRHGTICAALIDPEDFSPAKAAQTAETAIKAGISIILVGGSTASDHERLNQVIRAIKRRVTSPVMLFPGNITGVSRYADAILFSSLLNSTNPYFIVGAQALGAMEVFKSGLESIPMGYLVFGGSSATSFIGQVNPLPLSKPALAVIYALAARYLGMRTLYLEAGSGASDIIPTQTIELVRRFYDGILIVGGGITSADKAERLAKAGADILVIGNLLQTAGHEKTLRQIVTASKRS